MERLLTAHELAEILNLSVETIWRYTRQGKIPVIELGKKQYRYRRDDAIAALAGGGLIKEAHFSYSRQGEYTYQDYLKIPEDPGYRYELLNGCLVRGPSPSRHHQRVVAALFRQLAAFFDGLDPDGELLFAPLDVTLTSKNVVQPDILFVSSVRRDVMCEERIDGPCDLVVEVMSPTSRRKDRLRKLEIYRQAGIPHYWLVDPEECMLEAFVLKEGFYTLVFVGGPDDEFSHPEFPGLSLDLDRVFGGQRIADDGDRQ